MSPKDLLLGNATQKNMYITLCPQLSYLHFSDLKSHADSAQATLLMDSYSFFYLQICTLTQYWIDFSVSYCGHKLVILYLYRYPDTMLCSYSYTHSLSSATWHPGPIPIPVSVPMVPIPMVPYPYPYPYLWSRTCTRTHDPYPHYKSALSTHILKRIGLGSRGLGAWGRSSLNILSGGREYPLAPQNHISL